MNVPEKHENEYIKKYIEKGYKENFRIQEGELIASGSDKKYAVDEISIVAEHRFEGMSNPSDMSILYIIETSDGKKGSILAPYGPAGDIEVAEFFKEIPESQISHSAQIDL